jgi:hypothetical protein
MNFKIGQDVYYIDHNIIMLYRITEINKNGVYLLQYHPQKPGVYVEEGEFYLTFDEAFDICSKQILKEAYDKIDALKNVKNDSLKIWF